MDKMKTNQDGGSVTAKDSSAAGKQLEKNQAKEGAAKYKHGAADGHDMDEKKGAAKYKGAHDYDTSKGSHGHDSKGGHGAAKMGYSQSFGAARMNGYAKGAAKVLDIMTNGGAAKYMKHGPADKGHGDDDRVHTHKSSGSYGLNPNTGGMGAYSPSRLESDILDQKILTKIIKPTLKGLNDLKTNFKGFLYAGIMVVKHEPYLIEYNVRMGDPECQTILPRLKTDFFEIIKAVIDQNLHNQKIEWHEDKSISVVLCSKGYPEKYENNVEIKNLDKIKINNNNFIFHAGTKGEDKKIFSNGGRVLNFVSKSKNFKDAREQAINLIKNLDWDNGFYRKDIGYKVIDE